MIASSLTYVPSSSILALSPLCCGRVVGVEKYATDPVQNLLASQLLVDHNVWTTELCHQLPVQANLVALGRSSVCRRAVGVAPDFVGLAVVG